MLSKYYSFIWVLMAFLTIGDFNHANTVRMEPLTHVKSYLTRYQIKFTGTGVSQCWCSVPWKQVKKNDVLHFRVIKPKTRYGYIPLTDIFIVANSDYSEERSFIEMQPLSMPDYRTNHVFKKADTASFEQELVPLAQGM